MSYDAQNPFVTPDNPTGRYNVPFELLPQARDGGDFDPLAIYDQVDVHAGAVPTPVGVMAMLRIEFTSSAHHAGGRPPISIDFVGDQQTMRDLGALFSRAATSARVAAVAMDRR